MSHQNDLNIENYDLEDILNLFKLEYHFEEGDLKRAYKTALKTHPDRSNLPDNYFRFYMKAYKIVEKIFYFRCQRKKGETDLVYDNIHYNKYV